MGTPDQCYCQVPALPDVLGGNVCVFYMRTSSFAELTTIL